MTMASIVLLLVALCSSSVETVAEIEGKPDLSAPEAQTEYPEIAAHDCLDRLHDGTLWSLLSSWIDTRIEASYKVYLSRVRNLTSLAVECMDPASYLLRYKVAPIMVRLLRSKYDNVAREAAVGIVSIVQGDNKNSFAFISDQEVLQSLVNLTQSYLYTGMATIASQSCGILAARADAIAAISEAAGATQILMAANAHGALVHAGGQLIKLIRYLDCAAEHLNGCYRAASSVARAMEAMARSNTNFSTKLSMLRAGAVPMLFGILNISDSRQCMAQRGSTEGTGGAIIDAAEAQVAAADALAQLVEDMQEQSAPVTRYERRFQQCYTPLSTVRGAFSNESFLAVIGARQETCRPKETDRRAAVAPDMYPCMDRIDIDVDQEHWELHDILRRTIARKASARVLEQALVSPYGHVAERAARAIHHIARRGGTLRTVFHSRPTLVRYLVHMVRNGTLGYQTWAAAALGSIADEHGRADVLRVSPSPAIAVAGMLTRMDQCFARTNASSDGSTPGLPGQGRYGRELYTCPHLLSNATDEDIEYAQGMAARALSTFMQAGYRGVQAWSKPLVRDWPRNESQPSDWKGYPPSVAVSQDTLANVSTVTNDNIFARVNASTVIASLLRMAENGRKNVSFGRQMALSALARLVQHGSSHHVREVLRQGGATANSNSNSSTLVHRLLDRLQRSPWDNAANYRTMMHAALLAGQLAKRSKHVAWQIGNATETLNELIRRSAKAEGRLKLRLLLSIAWLSESSDSIAFMNKTGFLHDLAKPILARSDSSRYGSEAECKRAVLLVIGAAVQRERGRCYPWVVNSGIVPLITEKLRSSKWISIQDTAARVLFTVTRADKLGERVVTTRDFGVLEAVVDWLTGHIEHGRDVTMGNASTSAQANKWIRFSPVASTLAGVLHVVSAGNRPVIHRALDRGIVPTLLRMQDQPLVAPVEFATAALGSLLTGNSTQVKRIMGIKRSSASASVHTELPAISHVMVMAPRESRKVSTRQVYDESAVVAAMSRLLWDPDADIAERAAMALGFIASEKGDEARAILEHGKEAVAFRPGARLLSRLFTQLASYRGDESGQAAKAIAWLCNAEYDLIYEVLQFNEGRILPRLLRLVHRKTGTAAQEALRAIGNLMKHQPKTVGRLVSGTWLGLGHRFVNHTMQIIETDGTIHHSDRSARLLRLALWAVDHTITASDMLKLDFERQGLYTLLVRLTNEAQDNWTFIERLRVDAVVNKLRPEGETEGELRNEDETHNSTQALANLMQAIRDLPLMRMLDMDQIVNDIRKHADDPQSATIAAQLLGHMFSSGDYVYKDMLVTDGRLIPALLDMVVSGNPDVSQRALESTEVILKVQGGGNYTAAVLGAGGLDSLVTALNSTDARSVALAAVCIGHVCADVQATRAIIAERGGLEMLGYVIYSGAGGVLGTTAALYAIDAVVTGNRDRSRHAAELGLARTAISGVLEGIGLLTGAVSKDRNRAYHMIRHGAGILGQVLRYLPVTQSGAKSTDIIQVLGLAIKTLRYAHMEGQKADDQAVYESAMALVHLANDTIARNLLQREGGLDYLHALSLGDGPMRSEDRFALNAAMDAAGLGSSVWDRVAMLFGFGSGRAVRNVTGSMVIDLTQNDQQHQQLRSIAKILGSTSDWLREANASDSASNATLRMVSNLYESIKKGRETLYCDYNLLHNLSTILVDIINATDLPHNRSEGRHTPDTCPVPDSAKINGANYFANICDAGVSSAESYQRVCLLNAQETALVGSSSKAPGQQGATTAAPGAAGDRDIGPLRTPQQRLASACREVLRELSGNAPKCSDSSESAHPQDLDPDSETHRTDRDQNYSRSSPSIRASGLSISIQNEDRRLSRIFRRCSLH